MEMVLGAQVIKEDEVLSLDVSKSLSGFGFLKDFDMGQVAGLIKFTNWSSKSMMATAKDRWAGIIVEEARILSPTALGKDGMFGRLNWSLLSHGWLLFDRHNGSKKSKGKKQSYISDSYRDLQSKGRM